MAISFPFIAQRLRPLALRSLCFAAAVASWLPGSASAHQVWIEQDAQGARLHFGEYGMNLKEASPGYLDKLKNPTAWLRSASGKKTIELSKHARGLHFSGTADVGQSLVVEGRNYPLLEGHGDKPKTTCWTPAARYINGLYQKTTPELTLDILPAKKLGHFQLFFRGKPLSDTEVTMTAESGWVLKATSDDDGNVQFRLPWSSSYVVHARHRDETPGKRNTPTGTESFDAASFSTSLSFDTQSGLTAPARPTAKPANKMPAAKAGS